MSLDLECKTPNGKWFADIKAADVEDMNVKVAK
jgi:identified by metaGeneAnnotator